MSDAINNDDNAITPQGDAAASSGSVAVGGNVGGNIIVGDHNTIVNQYSTRESFLHQLPTPPHDFTGREQELTELREAVRSGNVMISALHGQGGVGKTALALKLADELKEKYPDAQFYLNLKGMSDRPTTPIEAMSHVIRSYNPTRKLPDSENELSAIYRSILHNKKVLLLLDNARDRAQVELLIPSSKDCLAIITSRNHFALAGMKSSNVDILSVDDARKLLITICPRLSVGTRHDASLPDEISNLCGYLPLALRAAASLLLITPDIDPETYITQLRDERTRLEKIGAEGVNISVEASLTLSYNQLSDDAKRAFSSLSVFPADFDAQAEEVICEDDGYKQLSELVKRSLVNYSQERMRYWLHDLARILAKRKSGRIDELIIIRRNHAFFYANTYTKLKIFSKSKNSIERFVSLELLLIFGLVPLRFCSRC
ncbi:NACHT domain-containing protein [Candidatus Woesearchaeota archaeon]|nr:NACHT domain-containing protein [Candidatus Woesearchaeota archaeon]